MAVSILTSPLTYYNLMEYTSIPLRVWTYITIFFSRNLLNVTTMIILNRWTSNNSTNLPLKQPAADVENCEVTLSLRERSMKDTGMVDLIRVGFTNIKKMYEVPNVNPSIRTIILTTGFLIHCNIIYTEIPL